MERYKYGIFDAQIILVTNWNLLKARDMLSERSLVTLFFQTVTKCIRDYAPCDKVILCWDLAPYHKSNEVPWLKANRHHLTLEEIRDYESEVEPLSQEERDRKVEQFKKDNPGWTKSALDSLIYWSPTEEEKQRNLENLEKEYELELIKNRAKTLIIEKFDKLGMISLIRPGWEADDFGILCSRILKDSNEKSYLCSKDSDWRYWISEGTDILVLHTKEIYNYKQNYAEVQQDMQEAGVTLLEYKALWDALQGSHNNYQKSIKKHIYDYLKFYKSIHTDEDYIKEFCEPDIFYPQYESFFIENYVDYEDTKETVTNILCGEPCGFLYEPNHFKLIKHDFKLNISENYYTKYYSILNKNCYLESPTFTNTNCMEDLDAIFNELKTQNKNIK